MVLHVNYEIRWKNYRGFTDTGWIEIRPLTVLIGANNSGKTSVFSPLLLMSQTIASRDLVTPLVMRGPLLDVGHFEDIIHNREKNRELFLGFRFHVHEASKKDLKEKVGVYQPGAIEVTLVASDDPERVLLKRYELFDIFKRSFFYQYLHHTGSFVFKGSDRNRMSRGELEAIKKGSPVNFLFSPASALYQYRRSKKPDASREFPKFTNAFEKYLQAVGFSFEEMRGLFSNLSYIGPLRERPRRHYEKAGEIPQSVGSRGENTANLLRRQITNINRKIDNWIKRFEFGDGVRVKDEGDDLFSLGFYKRSLRRITNIADAGFGASQVLPLIVQALAAKKGSLTIAEQPEIHLNPKLQCELADLFVDMANSDHRVIVETHSEHLLIRLRRLVASGKIDHSKIALYFIEKRNDESFIRSVPIEKNGHISAEFWPEGFFADSLRESLALASEQSDLSRTH